MMKTPPEWFFNNAMKTTSANTLQALLLAAVMTTAAPPLLLAQESTPITITPADFNIPKDEALERLTDLEAMAAVSVSTADYARAFRDFQDDLGKVRPPVSDWTSSERDRLESLKQPTEAAWQALALEEQQTRQRLQERGRVAEADWERRQQQQAVQQATRAQQAQADQQLRLQEAQIQETEARAEYYDELADDAWNSWYNPWWYSAYPGSPIHRRRHHIHENHLNDQHHRNTGNFRVNNPDTLRRPLVPNNYEVRPARRR